MLRRVLLLCFLACLASVAWGQDFGLDLGCCSQPIVGGTPVTVNGSGGGAQDFYNSTTGAITELELEVAIGAGQQAFANSVVCTSYVFFQSCNTSYDGSNLFFDFSGTVSDTETIPDEGFGFTDPETTEREGIPTLPEAACLTSPDNTALPFGDGTVDCTARGHFVLSFNTVTTDSDQSIQSQLQDPNGSGGWGNFTGDSANVIKINGVFVPEPPATVFLWMSLLFVAGIARWLSARHRA